MPKEYKVNSLVRFSARAAVLLLKWGVPMPGYAILTVCGRKSKQAYSVPVIPMEEDGQCWIVSPYGEVGWVKNARTAGTMTLTQKGKTRTVPVRELTAEEGAPILKKYITQVAITRPYFGTAYDAPVGEFVGEAAKHPVFRVI